jgi:general secretion pathway protein L
MIRQFLDWWGAQLLSFVPPALRSWSPAGDDGLVAEARDLDGATQIDLLRRRDGTLTPLGRFTRDRHGLDELRVLVERLGRERRAVLRLPDDAILIKDLSLPVAAERELAQVAAYEMDRETPFTVEEVHWDVTVTHRDRASGRIEAMLRLVPRFRVDDTVRWLESAGLRPVAIEAGSRFAPVARVQLPQAGASASAGRRVVAVLAGTCAVLFILALALPFVRQSLALGDVEARIEALKPQIAEVEGLKGGLGGPGAGPVALEAARVGNALAILAALTDAVPDHSYVTDLSLEARRLTLVGRSSRSTDLLSALARTPQFRTAAFAAPVSRIEGSDLESFTITADVAP